MRKFRVGDRVRWENRADGDPRWSFRIDCGRETATCIVMSGVVIEVNPYTFTVRADDDQKWLWPQPDQPNARYGAQGYLELVAAVEDTEDKDCTTCRWADGDHCDCHDVCSDARSQWEPRKHPSAPQKAPPRRITVQELAEKIEDMLCLRAGDLIEHYHLVRGPGEPAEPLKSKLRVRDHYIAKERAQAIAESLRGVEVEK